MLSNYRPQVKPLFEAIAKPISFIHPNIITVLGLFPSIFFIFALTGEHYIAALILLGLSVFDALDGTVARMTGKESAFGGVLDSTLDRISDFFYIAAFGVSHIVSWELVFILLLLTFLISYIRSRAELSAKGKIKLDIGLIERSERIVLIAVGVLVAWFLPNYLFLYFSLFSLLSFITVVQRLWYSYKLLNK